MHQTLSLRVFQRLRPLMVTQLRLPLSGPRECDLFVLKEYRAYTEWMHRPSEHTSMVIARRDIILGTPYIHEIQAK
jgi:hypothetical protein